MKKLLVLLVIFLVTYLDERRFLRVESRSLVVKRDVKINEAARGAGRVDGKQAALEEDNIILSLMPKNLSSLTTTFWENHEDSRPVAFMKFVRKMAVDTWSVMKRLCIKFIVDPVKKLHRKINPPPEIRRIKTTPVIEENLV